MTLTSDPHAWLRPIFATLRADAGFALLAPSHQFAQLCHAVAKDYPAQAASMREWSPTAQGGLLKWLADAVQQDGVITRLEQWRVQKGDRELVCIAIYIPTGIDVRLMENEDFRRTRLAKTALEAIAVAEEWKVKLLAHGWLKVNSNASD